MVEILIVDKILRSPYNLSNMQHKFNHLGNAPYTLVSYLYEPRVQSQDGKFVGGVTCDHCGRIISHVFIIKSKDGRIFNLGSVHVEDLGDKGLTKAVKEKVKEIETQARREKREAQWKEYYKKQQQEWEAKQKGATLHE